MLLPPPFSTLIPCIVCIRLRCRIQNFLNVMQGKKNKCYFTPLLSHIVPPRGLLRNEGFEYGLTYWITRSHSGEALFTVTAGKVGKKAAAIRAVMNNEFGVCSGEIYQVIEKEPNKAMELSLWTRHFHDGFSKIYLLTTDKNGNVINCDERITSSAEWENVTLSVPGTPEDRFAAVSLFMVGSKGILFSSESHFDDCYLHYP